MKRSIFIILVLGVLAYGCSGGNTSPFAPDAIGAPEGIERHHSLWGLWQGVIDPRAETIEFIQLRTSDFHLNALPFLEPPPFLNLTLESLEFNGDLVEVDIGLRHPFLGLTEFTGFDVCGIFITNGSVSGFSDSDLRMAGEGDTRLLNPDGYSRWWNPSEFPVNNGTIFGYTDGLLGAPDSIGDFKCTLNGYKYFCDDLDDPEDPLGDVTIENRGLFSAGSKNIRHYTIQLGGDGLIFNYAIDACWAFPAGDAPWQAPDDFAAEANRVEAWRIDVTEQDNSLYYEDGDNGGDLSLSVDVYDWFNPDLNIVRVEAPGQVPATASSVAVSGGAGYSAYQVDIFNCTPSAAGVLELLITIESEETGYGGLLPGEAVSAYFTITVEVDDEAPQSSDCPDVTNQAYPFTATPTTQDWRWCNLMPLVDGGTFSESCIDYDFLNNDQDRLVVNGRNALNQIGALTPQLYSNGLNPEIFITGVETCSIDCDLTDRIIYVLFDDSVITSTGLDELIPMRTEVVIGADTIFHVYDISEASEIGSGYNVGARIWAIETDAYDNVWVLDENRYMHHFINNGSSYTEDAETGFDLDDSIPSFSGIVYDMAIDYYNEAFYILTNGAEDGILYRVECDGTFNATVEGNPNPMLNVWEYTNNDRADIVIDNLDSSGNILQGEQDAQILCVANIPGDHFGTQSWMASKIGITRVDAALGSAVKYTFLGNPNVGYGACCTAINSRTNSMYTKCGPPYGNQYIVQTIFVPTSEWY